MDVDDLMARACRIAERHRMAKALASEDLEDVLQEVVARAWTTWQEDPPRNPDAWLQRVIGNAIIDHLRADGRRPADRFGDDDDDDPVTRAISAVQSSQHTSEGALQRDLLEQVFRLVESVDADLLRARYLDNRSARDIAEDLGITPAAVDQRTARARRSLKAALEAHPELLDALRQPHPHVYDARPPRREATRPLGRRPGHRGTGEP